LDIHAGVLLLLQAGCSSALRAKVVMICVMSSTGDGRAGKHRLLDDLAILYHMHCLVTGRCIARRPSQAVQHIDA
jgi:hypothetical protein